MIYLIFFLLGISIGSFINVLTLRWSKSILWDRSRCPRCLVILPWYDLIPIGSFIFLSGYCRNCKNKISLIYPIVEILGGIAFMGFVVFNRLSLSPIYILDLFLIAALISIIIFDYLYYIIPDKIVYPAVLITLLADFFSRSSLFPSLLISGLGLAGFFAILYLISRGNWIGFGDIKLIFLVGLIFGYPLGLFAVVISIWIAAIWGIGLILLKRATLKTALPFGLFLSAVSIFFLIFQNETQKIINHFF